MIMLLSPTSVLLIRAPRLGRDVQASIILHCDLPEQADMLKGVLG